MKRSTWNGLPVCGASVTSGVTTIAGFCRVAPPVCILKAIGEEAALARLEGHRAVAARSAAGRRPGVKAGVVNPTTDEKQSANTTARSSADFPIAMAALDGLTIFAVN